MIGASSGLRTNQPELSTASSTTPDIASSRPPSSAPQCSALRAAAPRSPAMAATPAYRRGSARSDRAAPARRSPAARTADRTTSACAVRAAVASAKPAISSNRPIAAEVVSSSSPASIDHANHALRRPWPINCQECSSSSAQSGRASTSGPNSTPGELKAVTVIVSSTASTACCPPTMARASRNSVQNVATAQSCASR